MGRKKPPRIYSDKNGEYIKEWYFVNGKQKHRKIYVVDGIPAEEFYEKYADPITLFQNGDYEILHKRGY